METIETRLARLERLVAALQGVVQELEVAVAETGLYPAPETSKEKV